MPTPNSRWEKSFRWSDDAAVGNPQGFALALTPEGRDIEPPMIAETADDSRIAWDFVNRYSPIPQLSTWRRRDQPLIRYSPRFHGSNRMTAAALANKRVSLLAAGRPRPRGLLVGTGIVPFAACVVIDSTTASGASSSAGPSHPHLWRRFAVCPFANR